MDEVLVVDEVLFVAADWPVVLAVGVVEVVLAVVEVVVASLSWSADELVGVVR